MSLYEIPLETLRGEPTSLREYAGRTVLLVNVASKCGLTPQYTGLETLHEELAPFGFSVVGFPCNQFGAQEPGSSEEIAQFCSATYGVTFPLLAKGDVKGPGQHALYAELTRFGLDDEHGPDVVWNFEKFLVSPEGEVVGRFRPLVTPEDPALRAAIDEQLQRSRRDTYPAEPAAEQVTQPR